MTGVVVVVVVVVVVGGGGVMVLHYPWGNAFFSLQSTCSHQSFFLSFFFPFLLYNNNSNPDKAHRDAMKAERKAEKADSATSKPKKRIKKLSQDEIDLMNNPEAWGDNAMTTAAWQIIHENKIRELRDFFMERPEAAHVRSQDGRGPMWWAHEYGRTEMVKLLKKLGVRDDLKDAHGKTARDLAK